MHAITISGPGCVQRVCRPRAGPRHVAAHVAACGRQPAFAARRITLTTAGPRPSCRRQSPARALLDHAAALPAGHAERLERVIASIDEMNRKDPNTVEVEGVQFPYELAYANWVSGWVSRLCPNPSEALLIAARGQHVCRWEVPRNSYPEGRAGYLQWREDMKSMHAQKVAGLMQAEGYPGDMVQRVRDMMLKKDLRDEDTQTLEDALCLVFFQHQYPGVAGALPPEKLQSVVLKTWNKMGIRGRAAAAQLPLPLPLPAESQA